VHRDPNFAEGHNNLGLVLLQSGNVEKAETEFKEAARLKPAYAEAHYNLALAFRQEGRQSQAQEEFEKAYQIAPELRNIPLP
jgi:protein O-GlcNAc transferase